MSIYTKKRLIFERNNLQDACLLFKYGQKDRKKRKSPTIFNENYLKSIRLLQVKNQTKLVGDIWFLIDLFFGYRWRSVLFYDMKGGVNDTVASLHRGLTHREESHTDILYNVSGRKGKISHLLGVYLL